MKKLLIVLLTIFIATSFCSCGESKLKSENTFVEGNLLFEIGAENFDDVEKCEIQCGCEEKHDDIIIEDMDALEFLCNYNYTSDYPDDKLHELLLYPNNFMLITVNGEIYRFRLLEDGSLVGVTSGILCRIYKTDAEHCLTPEKFDKLHLKYLKQRSGK